MTDIKIIFKIRIICQDIVPQITEDLLLWTKTQDRSQWCSYGYTKLTSGIYFFIHSHTPLSEDQVDQITKIIEKHDCAFIQTST